MRLTPWQFVGIAAAVLMVWAAYEYWWKYQDQGEWLRGMNHNMWTTDSDEEPADTGRQKKDDWL